MIEDKENKEVEEEDDFEVVITEDDSESPEDEDKPKAKVGESEAQEEGEEDDEPEDIEDLGKRAQKRIRRLVSERKEAERQTTLERERASNLETKLKEAQTGFQKQHIDTTENSIKSQLEALKSKFDKALEDDNRDELFEINSKMAKLNSKLERIDDWKAAPPATPDNDSSKNQEVDKRTAPPKIAKPDKEAQGWHKKNSWFQEDRTMTLFALDKHVQLINEGYDPKDRDDEDWGSNAYYTALDEAIKEEFPDRLKNRNTSAQPKQKVAGQRRSSTGKKSITITKSEAAMAKRLGIPVEQYAKQKLLIAKRKATQ